MAVDTIYALATPPGRSGVAVVRVSGPAWETYTVADIVEGEIWVGDEAKLR